MEEEVGFEPTERVNVRQFSRLLQSTALALLHPIAGYVSFLHNHFLLSTMCDSVFYLQDLFFMNCSDSN